MEVDPFCLVLLGVTLSGGVVWRVTYPVLTCFCPLNGEGGGGVDFVLMGVTLSKLHAQM